MKTLLPLIAGVLLAAGVQVMAQDSSSEAQSQGETNAVQAVAAQEDETVQRLDRLEKAVSEVEKTLGGRVVGSRSPGTSIEDQLADMERRLKRIERDMDDLERRVRRAERH